MARISSGTMTVGIFAVLFGLVGAYALRAALVGDAPPPPAPPRTTTVPLAARDLPAGREIQQGDIKLLVMTQADMEARKLPLEQTMLSPEQIIGRVIHEPIAEGGAFLTTNMFLEGTGPRLSDKLQSRHAGHHRFRSTTWRPSAVRPSKAATWTCCSSRGRRPPTW